MALLPHTFLHPLITDDMIGFPISNVQQQVMPRRGLYRYNPFRINVLEDLEVPQRDLRQQTKDTETGYETYLDLKGYNPKEIEVFVNPVSRSVIVEGSKKEHSAYGMFQMHFHRSVPLPEKCALEQVKTLLDKDGVLKVSAPKGQEAIEEKSKLKEGEERNGIMLKKVPLEVEEDKEAEPLAKSKESEDFEFKLDIEGFDPKDIQVQMHQSRGILSISAVKKFEEDGVFSFSQIRRDLSIDGKIFDLKKLNCEIGDDSKTLVLKAPKLSALTNENKRNIPIKYKH